MRASFQLILVGVGALIAVTSAASGTAQTVSNSSQKLTQSSPPKPVSASPTKRSGADRAAGARTAQSSPEPPAGTPTQPPTLTPRITEPSTPDPGPSRPIGPAKPGAPPQYLDPDPNPLRFPTNPDEVRLRGVQPITLQQALQLAERNNQNLRAQRLQLDRSRAGLREARAAELPTVTAQTGITRSRSAGGQLAQEAQDQANQNLPPLIQPSESRDTVNTALNGTVGINYDLFTSGLRPAQIRAAQRQLRSDELQVEITLEQLRQDVSSDYYDLQEADESVRINQASVRNNEISLRDAQALERAGLGTRFDTLRFEVQLANAQQQLLNARSQQEIRRRQLAQRLSVTAGIDLAAADPVDVAGTWELPLESSIVLAFKNRAELEQLLVQRELSEQQRRAALATLGPNISLSYQYQFQDSFDDSLGIADGNSISANVRWNLFDGGAARARARQQEANIAIAETQFADIRNQVRFQVEQAYSQLRSSFTNIATANRALEQARESLRLARLRFQAGVGTQTEVINSETDLTRAEGNRVTAILTYNRALAALRRAITNLPPGTGTLSTAPSASPTTTPTAPSISPTTPSSPTTTPSSP
ncbi:TolC family protein [Leptolyngbya sp. FACHB-36]|uniref:TolC family protein n=1 Tax=Leptolyngbya sp. FACHB-36 TaxID=2692808 RepID=UPI001680CD4C|nr:TolC family protein [Leptolyngbya sp. FACHB-36]MBD2020237.1 TolC family protein [Leptolyngbya sp. FACHB-36]